MQRIWREAIGVELEIPFPRMTYAEAMLRYGSDKPDLRFGLEIEDATELTRGSQFKVFAGAAAVRFMRVPQEYSRADLEKLEAFAKEWGAKGLAYIVYGEDGEARSPIAKFLSEEELAAFRGGSRLDRALRRGRARAGRARARRAAHTARPRARPCRRGGVPLVWVTDFPMFEWSEEDQRWSAVHHPFTRPAPESEAMLEKDPGRAIGPRLRPRRRTASELGGGSVRIHEPELQAKVFDILRITPEQQRDALRVPSRRARTWARRRTAGSRSASTAW